MTNHDKLTIRQFASADWDRVQAIFQAGLDSNICSFKTQAPSFEEWDRNHLEPCRLVAQYEDEVVGFAVVAPTSSRYVYRGVVEVSIYLDDNYTGKGIGTRLYQSLIEATEQAGYWTLYSSIMDINQASIALHERLGFRKIGYQEKIAQDRFGTWQDVVMFERRSQKIG